MTNHGREEFIVPPAEAGQRAAIIKESENSSLERLSYKPSRRLARSAHTPDYTLSLGAHQASTPHKLPHADFRRASFHMALPMISKKRRRPLSFSALALASVILTSLLSGTARAHRRRYLVAVPKYSINFRGGGEGAVDRDDVKITDSTKQHEPQQRKTWWSSAVSLFRNNNQKEYDTTQQRGGALTSTKPRPFAWIAPGLSPRRRNNMFDEVDESLSSQDADQEADTLSAQGENDTVSRNKTTAVSSSEVNDSSGEGSRLLWWNQAWAQQIPGQDDEAIESNGTSLVDYAAPIKRLVDGNAAQSTIPPSAEVQATIEAAAVATKTAHVQRQQETSRVQLPAAIQVDEDEYDTHRVVQARTPYEDASPYVSSGYWSSLDNIVTLGLARAVPQLRLSRKLRLVRKRAANVTGWHGWISRKGHDDGLSGGTNRVTTHLGMLRSRLAAIDAARQRRKLGISGAASNSDHDRRRVIESAAQYNFIMFTERQSALDEERRRERVREIDQLMRHNQRQLFQLACEKDVLQRRPNPLWNYTAAHADAKARRAARRNATATASATTRNFNFPSHELVDEYLEMLFATGRLVKLNHTDLWRHGGALDNDELDSDDDNEVDDGYYLSISGNSHRKASARRRPKSPERESTSSNNNNAGSWLLRNGLGEKVGAAAETVAYKATCHNVMSVLARLLSNLHGVNIMEHSDIRLFMEDSPHLPPPLGGSSDANYAQGALYDVMRRGAARKKKKRRHLRGTDAFLQRDAVAEMLLSHAQLSAPLLQLFPLAWQRGIFQNIITLITAVISDFFEGLEFQILGHRLAISFKPITEEDLMRNFGAHRAVGHDDAAVSRTEHFEAAVARTAEDLSANLKFLDRWHERALGSGVLRQQIANLIARLVLTLVDDVLTHARMDLWSTQAGGPRLVAGIEYRTATNPPSSGSPLNAPLQSEEV